MMFYLLDVRNTVLHQKLDAAYKKLEDLKHEKDVIYSFLLNYIDDEDKRKKEAIIIAIQNHDKSKHTAVRVNELANKIIHADVEYWKLKNRCYVYNEKTIKLDLTPKGLEHTKYIICSLINVFQHLMDDGKISKLATEFLTNEKCYRVNDELSKMFTNVGCVAFIDECYRILDVISRIESNSLIADNNDKSPTIESCVEEVQKTGIQITRAEFIETVHSNVWITDDESDISKLIKFDAEKETVNQMGE